MARAREFNFTDEKIAALPVPKAGEVTYRDQLCRGLCLRIGKSGARTLFYLSRDAKGKRTRAFNERWSESGLGDTFNVKSARARVNDLRGEPLGRSGETTTIGEILDAYDAEGPVSVYTKALLAKHLEGLSTRVAATLGDTELPKLIGTIRDGYKDESGREVGGPAVADKVRSALVKMFEWAQRRGTYPKSRGLPTSGLVRSDIRDIGWEPRERVPSEREMHQLFDALGIGTGSDIAISTAVSPRIPIVSRLAVLLTAHVPVRSGVGLLALPANAVDLENRTLRWETRKGRRSDSLVTPLSDVAVAVIQQLRSQPGGKTWLVPSPEDATRRVDVKMLARMFKRMQTGGKDGSPPRIDNERKDPFVPHSLRGLWTTLAGELGIEDSITVRVIGHRPIGASEAQKFYDFSQRSDPQRAAVERVSAELERIRRREPNPRAVLVFKPHSAAT